MTLLNSATSVKLKHQFIVAKSNRFGTALLLHSAYVEKYISLMQNCNLSMLESTTNYGLRKLVIHFYTIKMFSYSNTIVVMSLEPTQTGHWLSATESMKSFKWADKLAQFGSYFTAITHPPRLDGSDRIRHIPSHNFHAPLAFNRN